MLLKESKHPQLDGWPDWQLSLLKSASSLAVTAELRREWEEHTSQFSSGQQEGSWSGNYFAERLAMIRYQFIQEYGSRKQAGKFLTSNLHFSGFRELAIRNALKKRQYDEAIRLAEEGEAQDLAKGLRGLVTKWKGLRYEACRRSGKMELQQQIGKELVLEGDFSYYKPLKDSYPAEEWQAVYQSMLQKMENNGWHSAIYTRILVEERETERLLEYVKKQPARIEQFYPHLIRQFPTEVKKLFQLHIESTAEHANTRKHYQDVCRIIRMLQKAGGQAEALQITNMLLAKYPRKPAFREELMKLNYR
ncbi:hypothetical protein LSG31_02945 [Fodinisporobacter ferrooxydans]|uniref:Uncharacterized protein n=1 Tax=Fodinisporobacter ferrooxydans TaxID=2901836 RepID=A0ABY4CNV4_9BACL|nr:hypothetical protein LSG31_02945 [Alicyclobacillaceae bacterium MYW30-H2]